MGYENFYRLCIDYNFMLKDAVHFGVYSENSLENIRNELLELMAGDSVYVQYKPLLEEMHQAVSSRDDISRFFPRAQKVQGKARARKLARDIPLYMLCISAFVITGALPMIIRI